MSNAFEIYILCIKTKLIYVSDHTLIFNKNFWLFVVGHWMCVCVHVSVCRLVSLRCQYVLLHISIPSIYIHLSTKIRIRLHAHAHENSNSLINCNGWFSLVGRSILGFGEHPKRRMKLNPSNLTHKTNWLLLKNEWYGALAM